MSYRSVAEILNKVFDSSDSVLKATYKTDDEVLNLVLDESGEPALKVKLSGYIPANNIIDGEVSTYADLPTASEHINEIYVVDNTTGIPLINRKQAGMYRSDGAAWSLLDVDLSADKVYYSGTLTSGNVQDALNEVNATLSGKALAVDLASHLSNISNPHSVIKSQVGLGNVDNTSDTDKPISTAQQTALDAKMSLADYVGAVGNLLAPLTHLPLKKNLLTQQGQNICTFTRSGTATYRDRYGMLKTAAANTARFNENGLLLEGASTNLFTYSEQFDNAIWIKGYLSVSPNTTDITDPYGTNIADKLIEDTSNNIHYLYQNIVATSGSWYTWSIYAKAEARTQIRVYISVYGGAIFNLANGGITDIASGVKASCVPYTNGWYRCAVSFQATSTATLNVIAAMIVGGTISYRGDGVSGLYVFGAQLEAMPFATSYIPTTAAAATRVANTCSATQTDNMPAYSENFSIVMDVVIFGFTSGYTYLLGDGASSGLAIYLSSEGVLGFRLGSSINTSAISLNTKYRISIVKLGSNISIYKNGVLLGSGTLTGVPLNPSNLYVGSQSGSDGYTFSSISNLRIYDSALTSQEVAVA